MNLTLNDAETAAGFRVMMIGFLDKSDPFGELEFRESVVKVLTDSDLIFRVGESSYVHRRWGESNSCGYDSWHPITAPVATIEAALLHASKVHLSSMDITPKQFVTRNA
jgi:hypothetical protein